MNEPRHRPRAFWMSSLVAALLFLFVDSVVRLRGIDVLNTTASTARSIAPDSTTASGYEGNQHDLILPVLGTDGYHWAMQTQQMLAEGTARVRHVDYDGPPEGRPVHWSSLLRWWTAAFAVIASVVNDVPLAWGVESVSPWVNTLFLGVLLLVLVPVVAGRFGALPAALLAMGSVATYPVYEYYAVGNFDHHGLATSAAMLTVLFLLGGGGGWVRSGAERPSRLKGDALAVWEWLPDATRARAWFIASGVAGGAGLWISAATQIPALLGVGIAAVIGLVAFGKSATDRAAVWRTDPRLWLSWGVAGGGSSLFFYLLEYFPSHMELRLEVNHPVYAVAWFAAGHMLYRLGEMQNGGARAKATAWTALDAAVLVAVPMLAIVVPESFVLRPNSLVVALHEDYIDEFRSLPRQVAGWSWRQLIAGVGFLPLVAIGAGVALAVTKRVAAPLRTLAVLGLLPALAFTALAFRQGRWLGIGYGLWLVTLVAVATVATIGIRDAWSWTTKRVVTAGAVIALVLLPFPLLSVRNWIAMEWVYTVSSTELAEAFTRDVSRKLCARLGSERGVIASGPTTTTWMTYFGGFKGVGTLYWENHAGLEANARLIGATPTRAGESAVDVAYAHVKRLGVTHVALYSWGPFATEYARLAQGRRVPATPTAADDSATQRAFGPQLLQGTIPTWLRPMPYRVPANAGIENPWVWILEVTPDQTPREAAVRVAQFWLAMNDEDRAIREIDIALGADSSYVPALITLARVQAGNPRRGDARPTIQRIRTARGGVDSLVLEDMIALATVYMVSGDTARSREVVTRAIARADERSVRRLPWDYTSANFIILARQLNLMSVRPEITDLVFALLDPEVRAQLR